MTFWSTLASRITRRPRVARDVVSFDDVGVTRTLGDGRVESVAWAALQEVTILTTDGGPIFDDVLWLLRGSAGGCLVPGSAEGMESLLARLQELPGFADEAVVTALGSTSNASFTCWRRA